MASLSLVKRHQRARVNSLICKGQTYAQALLPSLQHSSRPLGYTVIVYHRLQHLHNPFARQMRTIWVGAAVIAATTTEASATKRPHAKTSLKDLNAATVHAGNAPSSF